MNYVVMTKTAFNSEVLHDLIFFGSKSINHFYFYFFRFLFFQLYVLLFMYNSKNKSLWETG